MKGAWGPFKPPTTAAASSRAAFGPLHHQPCAAVRLRSAALSRRARVFSLHVRGLQSSAHDSIGAGFVYKVSAAFTGKGSKFDAHRYHYSFDSESGVGGYVDKKLLDGGKKLPSGQDSFFAGNIGDSSAAAFGVTDGVGGYKDAGIDSADFAHGLCRHMRTYAEEFNNDRGAKKRLDPQQLLQEGYTRLCHDESVKGGGSTACVAVAEPDGTLNVANLGDSGFVQLRMNAVQFYSEPQTHAFNTPFQLSTLPPKMLEQIQQFGGSAPLQDLPKDADVTSHSLKHGDVLVFGTDGLWDNLSSQDVLDRVSTVMMDNQAWTMPSSGAMQIGKGYASLADQAPEKNQGTRPSLQTQLAVDITAKAKEASVNLKRDGPFAKMVQQYFPRDQWRGGKPDDICVLVALVVDQDSL